MQHVLLLRAPELHSKDSASSEGSRQAQNAIKQRSGHSSAGDRKKRASGTRTTSHGDETVGREAIREAILLKPAGNA